MIRTLIILSFILSFQSGSAQNNLTEHILTSDGIYATDANISDFNILVGSWSGNGLGGTCDEQWLTPKSGQMHGVFRMLENDTLIFTEFMTIMKDSTSFVMKIKHFGPDMKGWEAQDETTDFRFIKKEHGNLYFDGLTVAPVSKGKLNIYVAMKTDDGYNEELFEYTKK